MSENTKYHNKYETGFTPAAPAKTFKNKGLEVSIFRGREYEGKMSYRWAIKNRYFDKTTQEWKTTVSVPDWMLPQAFDLLEKVQAWLRAMASGERDPFPEDGRTVMHSAPMPDADFSNVEDLGAGDLTHKRESYRNSNFRKLDSRLEKELGGPSDDDDVPF